MKTQDLTNDTRGEIVIYQSEEGKAAIDVILQDETVWVTQEQMVALFGKAKSTISEHLKHIFEEGELQEDSVSKESLHITTSMSSFQSVIAFILCKVRVSVNGLPSAFMSISSKAIHLMMSD